MSALQQLRKLPKGPKKTWSSVEKDLAPVGVIWWEEERVRASWPGGLSPCWPEQEAETVMGRRRRFVLHLGKMFWTNKNNSALLQFAGSEDPIQESIYE